MPQVVDDGGSIPPTRSNPWVVGSNPSLAAKSSLKNNFIQLEEWESGLFQRSWKPPYQRWCRRFESGLLRWIYKFQKNLLYLLRFCYVFVCFKDSHRNNKKLKLIIWLLSFESCFILTNITDKWILWCDKEVVYLRHEMISNGGRGRLFFIKVVQ